MANTYLTGYSGTVRTLESLQQWSQWQNLDPEMQRRILGIMDASIVAGTPLGVGGTFRTYDSQYQLFLSRHQEVSVAAPHCCTFNGRYWQLRSGMAHAAPPGRSYHEATTPQGKCLAIDFIGNLTFLKNNAAAYGLKEFSNVNNEPWHAQPVEVPNARVNYDAAKYPLKLWALPGAPAPAPVRVFAPLPVLRQETRTTQDKAQVRSLQGQCNFWGWRDAYGQQLLVDGDFGAKTHQAVMSMQRALKITVDGVYGSQSYWWLQVFLDGMVGFKG